MTGGAFDFDLFIDKSTTAYTYDTLNRLTWLVYR